jgi:hypothetical protein
VIARYLAVDAERLAAHQTEQLLLDLGVLRAEAEPLGLIRDVDTRVFRGQFGFVVVQVALWAKVGVLYSAVDLRHVVLAHVA